MGEELNLLKSLIGRARAQEKLLEELKQIAALNALRTNRTKMVEVDLTVAHTDQSLGLQVEGRTYRWLTIERCDDSLNYKLKQTDGSLSDIFRAYESARISQHDFLDIIVSNPASSISGAVCRFVVGYWEE